MAMSGPDMAEAIRAAMGFPSPVSTQLIGWGNGVVEHIQSAAKVNHLSGTVNGTCPPVGSPQFPNLQNGVALLGLISAMNGSAMASLVANYAGYGSVSPQLLAFCNQIVAHIQTLGLVNFQAGSITGTCTHTLVSPGPLTNGAGTNGEITGLSGSMLANAVHGAVGYPGVTSTKLIQFCTGMVNYIMANGKAAYASGTVTGICPTGGGPLSAGTGVNGTIA